MDARPFATARDRKAILSPTQAIALGLVAASIGWAAWLLRDRPIREETELLAGSVLPSSELALMEAAFDRAQLTDYRTEGGRVYVPRSRQSAYMRALVDAEALPREFGGSLRRALANNSPWQSRAVQAELLRVATQDELSLVLCSMPGIERAAVLYDVEEQAGLAGGTVKTASVSIGTQPDTELDAARVQAIRVLVAASIAGLSPERVAVTDLRNGRVFAGPLEAVEDDADPAFARRLAYERALAAKLRQALAYVKGAIVDVTAEFAAADAFPPPAAAPLAQPSAAANAPAELPSVPPPAGPVAGRPTEPLRLDRGNVLASLSVSIAVPDSYLRAVHPGGGDAAAAAAAEEAELGRIRDIAARALPAPATADGCRVVVTRFPTPGATGPATQARAGATAPASPPVSLQEVVGRILGGDVRLDAEAVPRELLVAAGIIVAGLLAAGLWLVGGARRHAARFSDAAGPRIDWSRLDDRAPEAFEAEADRSRSSRLAA